MRDSNANDEPSTTQRCSSSHSLSVPETKIVKRCLRRSSPPPDEVRLQVSRSWRDDPFSWCQRENTASFEKTASNKSLLDSNGSSKRCTGCRSDDKKCALFMETRVTGRSFLYELEVDQETARYRPRPFRSRLPRSKLRWTNTNTNTITRGVKVLRLKEGPYSF